MSTNEQAPAPVAGEEDAPPASEQPVEAIGAGREEIARIIRDRAQIGGTDWQRNARGADINAEELADLIAALSPASLAGPEITVWYGKMPESNGRENWTAELRRVHPIDKWDRGFCFARSEYPGRVLYEADRVRWIIGERAERPDILAYDADAHSGYVEPASPARTPMGGPQVLKGVGKINGDGWKDTTTIGEVVYVWHAEKPSPYAPGQYPRIWNEGWSASTAQYDFSPASIDEVRALADPTPMGGEVEALREAINLILPLAKGYVAKNNVGSNQSYIEHAEALAASSPSPAQGGTRGKSRGQIAYEGWAQGLAGCKWSNQTATQKRAWELAASAVLAAPTPMGGEVEALREAENEICPHGDNVPADLEPGDTWVCPKCDAEWHTDDSQALAASSPSPAQGGEASHPSVQPVEGK